MQEVWASAAFCDPLAVMCDLIAAHIMYDLSRHKFKLKGQYRNQWWAVAGTCRAWAATVSIHSKYHYRLRSKWIDYSEIFNVKIIVQDNFPIFKHYSGFYRRTVIRTTWGDVTFKKYIDANKEGQYIVIIIKQSNRNISILIKHVQLNGQGRLKGIQGPRLSVPARALIIENLMYKMHHTEHSLFKSVSHIILFRKCYDQYYTFREDDGGPIKKALYEIISDVMNDYR